MADQGLRGLLAPQSIHALSADLGSKHGSEPVPPEPHRLVADVDAARGQEVPNNSQGQLVFHLRPHHATDDLRG
jgi:hypothetical protein